MPNQFTRKGKKQRPRSAKQALTTTINRKKLTVRLDHDQHKNLQLIAVTTGRTMNDIVAELIDTYVRDHDE